MRKTKIILSLLITGILLVTAGCGEVQDAAKDDGTDKIKVVTTIFPPYDYVRQIAGENVELTMLLKPGAESHTYEPTPQDILAIQDCDVFLYLGGESDEWVRRILESVDTEGKQILSMMDMVEPVEEEAVEGMQGGDEHTDESGEHIDEPPEEHIDEQDENTGEHIDEQPEEHIDENEAEYDEHVWTDPQNAKLIVEQISQALVRADVPHAETYEKNTKNYTKKLDELDEKFREMITNAARKTIVVGDRFPFRYFTEAYGLSYFAAFPGCASESEPSASTVAFLIEKIKAEKIPVVFTIELSNGKMAETIAEATGAKVRLFHSCHNVSADDFNANETYLSLMEKNFETMKEALQ